MVIPHSYLALWFIQHIGASIDSTQSSKTLYEINGKKSHNHDKKMIESDEQCIEY